jgi:uncharacterized protein (DUF1501 family)
VNQSELQRVLTEFAADRLAIVQRHEAGARVVSHYDFNNAYQYIINREETHLGWLRDALSELGSSLPQPSAALAVPELPKRGRKVEPAIFRGVLEDDARSLAAFVERWRPRVAPMTHVRHRNMLNVILGESLEHARLFDQAASGFEDLLGRRTGGVARQGGVLPTRWME